MRFLEACTQMPFGIGSVRISRRCGGEWRDPSRTLSQSALLPMTKELTHTHTMLRHPEDSLIQTSFNDFLFLPALFMTYVDKGPLSPSLMPAPLFFSSWNAFFWLLVVALFFCKICLVHNDPWVIFSNFCHSWTECCIAFIKSNVPFPIWVRCLIPSWILIYFYFTWRTWGQTFFLFCFESWDERSNETLQRPDTSVAVWVKQQCM